MNKNRKHSLNASQNEKTPSADHTSTSELRKHSLYVFSSHVPHLVLYKIGFSIFFHLAVLVCLTYIKHKFLCLIFICYELLCLTIVFQHFLSLKSCFVLVLGILSFCSHTISFSSVCSCLSHYKVSIYTPH